MSIQDPGRNPGERTLPGVNSLPPSPEVLAPDTGTLPPPPDLLDLPASTAVATAAIEQAEQMRKRPPASPLQESLRRLRRDTRAMISLGILVFLVVLALAGPPIYQSIGSPYKGDLGDTVTPKQYHGFSYQDLSHTDEGPSAMHWAGTDNLGRDMLARLMQGLLVSLAIALAVEIIDVGLGVTIGVLAGYYGGWIDQFLARFTDLMFAFPGLLFVILLTGIFGSYADSAFSHIPIVGQNGNARLLLVAIALSITIWPLMARYVRGQTLQLKQQQFIEAARTVGTSDFQIIIRHIIPNLFSIVFIASTLNVANTIIGEAGISLLGLGVQPPGSSIGVMISDALEFTDAHPWEVLFPTIVLTIIVLAISFFGDGLRDAFDPRSKD